jgi:hypothetical protein
VGAALIRADRRDDELKLIGAFRGYANTPKTRMDMLELMSWMWALKI